MASSVQKKTSQDFKFVKLIGEGSYSSVYLAVDAVSCDPTVTKFRKYAIKVCQKALIKRENKQAAVMREKEIMNLLNQHPNEHFIKLYCTFQDLNRLFFVMTYAERGDLLTYMHKRWLNLITVKYFTYQLIEALEHLHRLDVVHRDLKPENILLNSRLRLMISDFGSAQIYTQPNQEDSTSQGARRNSFVGTAQYVSPEMLKSRQATNKSDLWALGIIIYQMSANKMPFDAPNEYLIYKKIQSLLYEFPEDLDTDACDLIYTLLKIEPLDRLGATDNLSEDGYVSLRRHKFLSDHDDQSVSKTILSDESSKNHPIDVCLEDVHKIKPGLDESQLLRLLTFS